MKFVRQARQRDSTPTPEPVRLRDVAPSQHDAAYHYNSADYWLRVAEQPGRSTDATAAAAALSQAHASLGALAHQMATHVRYVNRRSA